MATVAELKAELRARGLSTNGLKAVLESRLADYNAAQVNADAETNSSQMGVPTLEPTPLFATAEMIQLLIDGTRKYGGHNSPALRIDVMERFKITESQFDELLRQHLGLAIANGRCRHSRSPHAAANTCQRGRGSTD